MSGVHKMVKHTSKILQHLLQNFEHMFNHFMNARHWAKRTQIKVFEAKILSKNTRFFYL